MKLTLAHPPSPPACPPPRAWARRTAGFTMVEIAIALGVVAFALVAIVGVLPTGLTVQKQNREETIINQDGTLWLDAIRSGAIGLDYLTNYVDYIQITHSVASVGTEYFSYSPITGINSQYYRNGRDIIGLLTQPRVDYDADRRVWVTHGVTAYVRTISGSAVEKYPGNDLGLMYRMTVELTPVSLATGDVPSLTNYSAQTLLPPLELAARKALYVRNENLRTNLADLRVTLEWPVYPQGRTGRALGTSRKEFHTLAAGRLVGTNVSYLRSLEGKQRQLLLLSPGEFVRTQ